MNVNNTFCIEDFPIQTCESDLDKTQRIMGNGEVEDLAEVMSRRTFLIYAKTHQSM